MSSCDFNVTLVARNTGEQKQIKKLSFSYLNKRKLNMYIHFLGKIKNVFSKHLNENIQNKNSVLSFSNECNKMS